MGRRQSSSGDNSSVDSTYGVWEKKQIEQSTLSHKLIIKSVATVQGRVRPSALWISDWWHVARNPVHMKNRLLSLVKVALTGSQKFPFCHSVSPGSQDLSSACSWRTSMAKNSWWRPLCSQQNRGWGAFQRISHISCRRRTACFLYPTTSPRSFGYISAQ